jgi:hypothetical protein
MPACRLSGQPPIPLSELPAFHSEQRLPPNARIILPFCRWEGLFARATGTSSFCSARCPWGPCRR